MQAIHTIEATRMQETNDPIPTGEEDRWVLAAKENPARFATLYERYYARILGFVYQRVTTKDDAYDITQQVFLQAMLSLHKYELRGYPFSSWLYRIAINELNNQFRKGEKQRGINMEERHLKSISAAISEDYNESRENALMQALTTLEEEDLQLIEMRFFEERPFKEIAEILNITEANAKMKVYRILAGIKPEVERNMVK